MTLYEIDAALLELVESGLDPETGEWNGDPEAWARLSMEREVKVENTGCYIKNLRADAAAIKAEEDALRARRKTMERKADWLAEMLRRSLDGQNYESARCTLRFKKNPESVRITDEEAALQWAKVYAPDCLRYKAPTLSLSDLKAEIKKGTEIPGAELVRETRLEVK